MKPVILLLAILAFIVPAGAQNPMNLQTGRDIYILCNPQNIDSALLCATYISGLSAGLKIGLVSADRGAFKCWSKTDRVGDELLNVRRWMKEHQHFMNEEAATVVGAALLDSYRCQN